MYSDDPTRFARRCALAVTTLLFGSCAGAGELRADCVERPAYACIVAHTADELAGLEDDRAWLTAAAETALGAAAHGDARRAEELLRASASRLSQLAAADRVAAQIELAGALLTIGAVDRAGEVIGDAEARLDAVADGHKGADLGGKLAVLRADAGQYEDALEIALRMRADDDTYAAYKARTLHDIAPRQARAGLLPAAVETLSALTMSIPYYRAVSLSDVASLALATDEELGSELFAEAERIARAQDDGYFVAGALRQIGDGYVRGGRLVSARRYFDDAAAGARGARTAQERARAVSRVATSLADHAMYERARELVADALEIAETEETEALRAWAHYEIAGAAAFAGDFSTAEETLGAIPASVEFSGVSLRSATLRDVAWGYARHGRVSDALVAAGRIEHRRERIQAYARILSVMADPEMAALPRYL